MCLPYEYALYECLICMPYMSAADGDPAVGDYRRSLRGLTQVHHPQCAQRGHLPGLNLKPNPKPKP